MQWERRPPLVAALGIGSNQLIGVILRIESGLRKSEEVYRISSLTTRLVLSSPFVIVFLTLLFQVIPLTQPLAHRMLKENHLVELLTFVSLLFAGIIGLKLAWKTWRHKRGILVTGFYVLFSIGLLLVAMEEVSWGQWFFGFETPSAIKAVNKQGELNFHNMPALHAPCEFLRVAFGLGGLFGVWLSSWRPTRNIGAPAILSSWFLLVAILAALDIRNYYIPHSGDLIFDIADRLVEVLELLIGLSAFFYMWLNGRKLSDEWGQGEVPE